MAWRSLLLLALVVGATATATNPKDQNSCQSCRKIVSLMERFNRTVDVQQMSTVFKLFCEQYYPPSTDYQQGPCPVFAHGITYILSNTDPVTHCDEINACGSKQPSDDIYQYLEHSNSIEAANKPGQGDKIICDYCQNLVEQFKTMLSNPDAVRRLHEQADAFCSYLKVIEFDKQCKEAMDSYLSQAIDFIRGIDSKAYCASIHMCPKRSTKVPASGQQLQLPTLADFNNFGIETAVSIGPKPLVDTSEQRKLKGPECTLCKTVVKEMFNFLRENKTEANIINGLNRVCRVLYPSEPKLGECKSMVKAYTREIVQLLVDETDPEVICMILEQCAYDKSPVTPKPAEAAKAAKSEIILNQAFDLSQLITALDSTIPLGSLRACVECKMFIKYLKDRLENPQSQAELKQWLLENLCQELPEPSLVKSCSSMVESYADVFFKAIAGDLNPQTACVELGVCNAKSLVQVLNIGSPSRNPNGVRQTVVPKERRCTRCTDVVALIDDYLAAHPRSEDMATVSRVCETIENQSVKGECLSIVRQYGADMVQLIPTMESPRHLCKQIAMC